MHVIDLTTQVIGFVLFYLVLLGILLVFYFETRKVDPTHDKCKQTRDRLQRDYEAAAASAVFAEERLNNIMKEFKREDKMTRKALERIDLAHANFFLALYDEDLSVRSRQLLNEIRKTIDKEIAKTGN